MNEGRGEEISSQSRRCGNIFLDMLCDNVYAAADEDVVAQLARWSECFGFRLRYSLCESAHDAGTNWGRHGGLHWRCGRYVSSNGVRVCVNVYRASVGVLPNAARWSGRSGTIFSCRLCMNAYGIADVGFASICRDWRRRFGTISRDKLCANGGPSQKANTEQGRGERCGDGEEGGAVGEEDCSGSDEDAGMAGRQAIGDIHMDIILLHGTAIYSSPYDFVTWDGRRRRFGARGPGCLSDGGPAYRGGRGRPVINHTCGDSTDAYNAYIFHFVLVRCGEFDDAIMITIVPRLRNTPGGKAYLRVGEATNPGPLRADDDGGWLRDGAVRYRDPGQDGFRYARQPPAQDIEPDPIADEHYSMVIDTINGTTWNSIKRYLHCAVADVILIQEHHLGPTAIPAAKAWALRHGWQPIIEPAIEGEGDGWRGGVGILARRHLGLSSPRVGQQELVQARAAAALIEAPGYRGTRTACTVRGWRRLAV